LYSNTKDGKFMIASHVHDALSQVDNLQKLIIEKRRFKGYSWIARLINAILAFACAFILSIDGIATTDEGYLIGWGILLVIALIINYGFVTFWFLFDLDVKKDFNKVLPVFTAVPTLFVGAIISLSVIINKDYQYLYGIWMCMFGMTHLSYRFSLPKVSYAVGIYYIFCGIFFLLIYPVAFSNPWPMGIVFCMGELFGSYAFYQIRKRKRTGGAE
jgi:hypothetical protein